MSLAPIWGNPVVPQGVKSKEKQVLTYCSKLARFVHFTGTITVTARL
jgi:hypothetical protein